MKKNTLILIAVIIFLLAGLSVTGALFWIKHTREADSGDNRQSSSRHERESDKESDRERDPEDPSAPESDWDLPGAKAGVFAPLVTGKLGDHIYFTDNLLKDRNLTRAEEKEVIDFLTEADRKLDTDILVVGWTKSTIDNHLIFNAYQYIGGAAVINVHYWTPNNNYFESSGDMPPLAELDTSDLTDPDALAAEIEKTAQNHSSEMLMDSSGKIYGTYSLECDVFVGLYYSFRINEYSEIKADAKTGEIISEYYFNGEYTD